MRQVQYSGKFIDVFENNELDSVLISSLQSILKAQANHDGMENSHLLKFKIYSFKIGFDEIIVQLEKQQKKAVDEAQANIKRLREFGKY